MPVPVLAPAAPLVGSVKIVSVMSRTGFSKVVPDQIINAYRMALEEHAYQIGGATLSLEDLSDTSPDVGTLDADSETRIDNGVVNDPDVLVYLGPTLSILHG
jgi:hypothetical protein